MKIRRERFIFHRYGSPCYPFLWQKINLFGRKTTTKTTQTTKTTETILPYHFYQVYVGWNYPCRRYKDNVKALK